MTQKEDLLQMLNNGNWRCGSEFLQAYLSEYRSLINKLRRAGYQIVTRSCENPGHAHKSRRMQEWKINGYLIPYKIVRQALKGFPGGQNSVFVAPIRSFCCVENWQGAKHNPRCYVLKTQPINQETTQRLL